MYILMVLHWNGVNVWHILVIMLIVYWTMPMIYNTNKLSLIRVSINSTGSLDLCNPTFCFFLFKSYCCSYYGSCCWDLNSTFAMKMYTQWNKAVRNIWHLPYKTHKCLLPHIVHNLSMKDQMLVRFIHYYASLLKSDNYVINYFCLRSAYYADSTLGTNCAYIAKQFKLNVQCLNIALC